MGNDQGGPAAHDGVHSLFDLLFGPGIHGTGGFVQDQDGGSGNGRPGNGQKLALSLGQGSPVMLQDRIVAVLQMHDEIMGKGPAGRFLHLFVRGIHSAIADVLPDRPGKKMDVLQDHGYVLSQKAPVDQADRDRIDQDLPFPDLVKAVDQARNGGLARSCGAYESDLVSLSGTEGNVMKDRMPGNIAEGHMVKDHFSPDLLHGKGLFSLLFLRLRIHDLKDPLSPCQGGKDRIHLHGNIIDGPVELTGIVQRYRQAAHVKAPRSHHDAARTGSQGIDHVAELVGNRAHDAGTELGCLLCLSEFPVQIREFIGQDLLVSEDPDHLLAGNGLLGKGIDHAQGSLLGPVGCPAPFNDLPGDQGQDRGCQDGNGPQDQVRVKHENHSPCQGNGARNDLDQSGIEHLSHCIDIVGIAAHQVSRPVGIEIGHRQRLHPGKKVCPHPAQSLLGDLKHESSLQILGSHRKQVKDAQKDQCHGQPPDPLRKVPVCGIEVDKTVDDRPQQVSQGKGRYRIGGGADKSQDQKNSFSCHIVPEPSDDLSGIRRLSGGSQSPVPGGIPAHIQFRGPSSDI